MSNRTRQVSQSKAQEGLHVSEEEKAFVESMKGRVNLQSGPGSANNSPRSSVLINGVEHKMKPEWMNTRLESQISALKENHVRAMDSNRKEFESAIQSLEKRLVVAETRIDFLEKERESCCCLIS
jgi:hypothetical protein